MNANRKSSVGLSVLAALSVLACSSAGPALARGELRDRAGGYSFEVLVNGQPVPSFPHRGETYVLGQRGERYVLRVHNHTGRRAEAVVSVDGLDVVDGRPASFDKRGYLVPAWGSVDIDGWRLSNAEVATFRFSSVGQSYAAKSGRPRDVGVIGVAVFPERVTAPPRPITPYPPYYRRHFNEDAEKSRGSSARSEAPRSAPADESIAADEATQGVPSGRGAPTPQRHRPGLGTEFGEARGSGVHEVAFVRAHPRQPTVVLGARYNDRNGLYALGIDVDGDRYWSDADLRVTATPFPASTTRYARPPRGWNGR